MTYAALQPITVADLDLLHPAAQNSVFWEFEPAIAQEISRRGDNYFEKEAWLSSALLFYGTSGHSIVVNNSAATPWAHSVRATVLYCPHELAPGAVALPTAPISRDADIISSLFISPGFAGIGMEAVLIDAALIQLTARGVPAVEAFGWTGKKAPADAAVTEVIEQAEEIGLIPVDYLVGAGFEVVAPHPVLPRLRITLPPAHGLLSAQAVEDVLATFSLSVQPQ